MSDLIDQQEPKGSPTINDQINQINTTANLFIINDRFIPSVSYCQMLHQLPSCCCRLLPERSHGVCVCVGGDPVQLTVRDYEIVSSSISGNFLLSPPSPPHVSGTCFRHFVSGNNDQINHGIFVLASINDQWYIC